MCGIVGYIGPKEACEILLKGLKRLEYRGYDSAGICLFDEHLKVYKKKGKVSELEGLLQDADIKGHIGIGHTRWATHGVPNDVNAHPHYSSDKKIALVHNGIIENYAVLKQELLQKGHVFLGETDTEVLVHFIEQIKKDNQCSIDEAVRIALTEVIGAYAIVVVSEDAPGQLVAARKGSPLVVGVGKQGEYFLASDATPIVEYTQDVIYLDDEEVAVIANGGLRLTTIRNVEKTPYLQHLDMSLEAIEKGGFEHFMLKEIMEQPKTVADCMRGRVNADENFVGLGGVRGHIQELMEANRIIIVACGTSWHAGLVAEYMFEELTRIPVEVEYASEFRYRNPIIKKGDVLLAISQSGETADTLAAIEIAKEKGATILGICNVVGSSIARVSHAGAYTHAGPEIGVASTKAFTAQLTVLLIMALMVAKEKGEIGGQLLNDLLRDFEAIPSILERMLPEIDAHVRRIAAIYKDAPNCLYLGRGFNFPVALEGALKLKEISYIHAEGYPAAEMKHGPIALIDEDMPVIVIATRDSSYDKIVSNIQEVKARKGKVIAIVTKGDQLIPKMVDHVIEVEPTQEMLMPILSVIPLQLLSYYIALMRGCDVDQPRNLAKSVTVE